MSNNKYKRLPKSMFSHIETLVGLSELEIKLFSYHSLNHFFRVTLWDIGKECAGCHKPIKHLHEATLDHILPRIYGGRTRLSNLQLMHERCNGRKSMTLPDKIPWNAMVPVKSKMHLKMSRRVLPLPRSAIIKS